MSWLWELKMMKSLKERFNLVEIARIVRKRESVRLEKLELEKQENFQLKEEYKQCLNYLEVLDWILNE